ncbi:hypothetical protein ZWY2020_048312 [Hordeum vulgare]|nr:hypothetical protein ZWY2020_048312 [Hordeum vulgare]
MPLPRQSARVEEENLLVRLAARCASWRQLDQLHARVVLLGHACNSFIAAKLVRAFADLGHLGRARAVATALGPAANAFVWTALVRAHSQSDAAARDAVALYAQMHHGCPGIKPLTFTVSSVLKAAARRKMLQEGEQVHVHVFKNGFQTDERIATTLVDFYAKCSRLDDARRVFDRLSIKDAQLYNTMIAAYMEVGEVERAEELFETMPERNAYTLVEMVCGYSAHGDMDSAKRLFDIAVAKGAENSVVCTAMISGYAKLAMLMMLGPTYSNVEIGEVAASHLFKLEPNNVGNYVLLSNIYANAKKWDGVQKVRALMRRLGMKKPPGWSQVDAEGSLREFITGELDSALEAVLEILNWELKDHGYTPIIEDE